MRILFAEDDRDLNRAVSALMTRANYSVDSVYDGRDAFDYAMSGEYDALVLDVMMPKMDGFAVVRALRQKGLATPCLMLTAKDAVSDKIEGLDAGADDYLPKPFDTGELLARLRALTRRNSGFTPDVIRFADLSLDRAAFTLSCGENSAKLSNKAFQVMELLMREPRRVHPAEQMMEKIWGWDSEAEINVVWVNISFLRKKITELGAHVEIRASRGAGYSLEEKA
ncbi:MAG: response regulator transcription factor [Clostridia bacterium]|nr:response regulator transcription factor [Clostridia bacterium]